MSAEGFVLGGWGVVVLVVVRVDDEPARLFVVAPSARLAGAVVAGLFVDALFAGALFAGAVLAGVEEAAALAGAFCLEGAGFVAAVFVGAAFDAGFVAAVFVAAAFVVGFAFLAAAAGFAGACFAGAPARLVPRLAAASCLPALPAADADGFAPALADFAAGLVAVAAFLVGLFAAIAG